MSTIKLNYSRFFFQILLNDVIVDNFSLIGYNYNRRGEIQDHYIIRRSEVKVNNLKNTIGVHDIKITP